MNPATNYTPPATFGRFRLQHQIGAGVLGPVFRTEDPETGSVVAVKAFVIDITPERARDLAGEFQHVVDLNLRHPRVAHAVAAGVEGSVAYLAQQYVDAESLDVAIRQYGPAPFSDTVRLITHIAEALDEAGRLEIFHGSLHPRDVLVTPGDTHVTGIGVAWALERIAWRTPVRRPYAAPEREVIGSWAASADVYGLAAIAYEVLTGRRAMPGTDDPLPGLNDLRAADPPALREALESALDRDPHRRPATAHDLVRSIAVGLLGAAAASVDSGDGRLAGKGQRRVRTKAPRLPGFEDPLIAKAIDIPPSEPGQHLTPKPLSVEPSRDDQLATSASELPPIELEVPAYETPSSLPAVDFSSLELPPAQEDAEPDVAPDFSALEDGPPVRSPKLSSRPPLRIDDLRLPGNLVTEPLVPRALDPATQNETPFSRPEPPRERAGWGLPAMVATLCVGIAIGLLGGYQLGTRRSTSWSDARPASAKSVVANPPVTAAPAASALTPTRAIPKATPPQPEATAPVVPRAKAPVTRAVPPTPREEVPLVRPRIKPLVKTPPARPATPRPTPAAPARAKIQAPPVEPKPADDLAPAASMQFETRPPGARVVLDGREVGRTPLDVPAVSAGSHTVRFELDGYAPWTSTVTTTAGQRLRVAASLDRGPGR